MLGRWQPEHFAVIDINSMQLFIEVLAVLFPRIPFYHINSSSSTEKHCFSSFTLLIPRKPTKLNKRVDVNIYQYKSYYTMYTLIKIGYL